jgi:hypothetical protein
LVIHINSNEMPQIKPVLPGRVFCSLDQTVDQIQKASNPGYNKPSLGPLEIQIKTNS